LETIRGTTILSVRRHGKVVIGGDGQVSMGSAATARCRWATR
jgi:ATP-dependent HslUV protease subunit HslV